MIFSKIIYKLPSGSNPTLYNHDGNTMTLFFFKDGLRTNSINVNNFYKCTTSGGVQNYNKIIKINQSHICACFDSNLTIK